MSSEPSGLLNYSKLDDKDKSYIVKTLTMVFLAVVAGIATGILYINREGWTAALGFGIFFLGQVGLTLYLKQSFDLSEMDDTEIFRHGIVVGFILFIFIWTVIFQFFVVQTY